MYSRNLGKNAVRASPSYTVSHHTDLFSPYPKEDESRYRYNLPAKYDGSRFSRTTQNPPPELKHHTAPIGETNQSSPRTNPQMEAPHEEASEENDLPQSIEPSPTCSDAHPLSHLIAALKEHVSGEDLLLIVIILMLAAEGENAELTILLLSLLLLVK